MEVGCDFCLNATWCPELTDDSDLSYCVVGKSVKGFAMYFRSGDRRDTAFVVMNSEGRDIASYSPKYCPECGRRLVENLSRWRKEGWPAEFRGGLFKLSLRGLWYKLALGVEVSLVSVEQKDGRRFNYGKFKRGDWCPKDYFESEVVSIDLVSPWHLTVSIPVFEFDPVKADVGGARDE